MASYSVLLDDYPENDNTASGMLFRKKVKINDTGVGCPLKVNSKGELIQCDANKNSNIMPCDFLAVQPGEGMRLVLWSGTLRCDKWTWAKGDRIYVSTVEGALTKTKPGNGHWIQEVGVAIYPNVILFRPKNIFKE